MENIFGLQEKLVYTERTHPDLEQITFFPRGNSLIVLTMYLIQTTILSLKESTVTTILTAFDDLTEVNPFLFIGLPGAVPSLRG